MKIDDYLVTLERSLDENLASGTVDSFQCIISDDYNGVIRCRVVFWDDSFLDLYELVTTELGFPVRLRYSYSYLHLDALIFRYDNAPHHPEIVTHPHHKHVGATGNIVPSDQPSLGQVLDEINGWLQSNG